jgi:flagellar motor protein MotB
MDHPGIGKRGLDPTRLEAAGYGEYQRVAPNNTPVGRRENRHIDIVLTDMNF